ncbi:MAG TPA: hypothetical protein VKC56_04980 [Gallionellaceae bacterium]|nr:hypothetical protein [Gallionellaceae bacterium]
MRPSALTSARARLIARAGLLCALASPAWASSASVSFPVRITLNQTGGGGAGSLPAAADPPASGMCINQALSQATRATVTVVCSTNQFVSIAPLPGAPYIGTHGGAYRYLLTPATLGPDDGPDWQAGTGTITTLQILHIKRSQWDITEIQISY